MSFIDGVRDEEATGRAAQMFEEDLEKDGYVWNATRVLALRPDVVDAWRALIGTIRSTMDQRRYELITIAAARAIRSSYCVLAHSRILTEKLFTQAQVVAMVQDPREAGITPAEAAMMDFAARAARAADGVTQADVDGLRAHGFGDREILDIALVAGARCFFSKTLDAVGTQPDAAYRKLPDAIRDVLTVGRPIAEPAETR
ncbi:MAG TPA: carboxymuconolactone decarboxylase family protein [Candidatus Saccharimonadaceae bacterium]|jgi:uncharacterized peroxidase-related enzyme|nr:carboxymuconolactone decarboxylase family protein [Candidatus Saccharimonadaceae bacterium]